jgi:hypothetical protein
MSAVDVEQAMENMLPVQKRAILEAMMAGCTFQGFITVRRVGHGHAYRRVTTTNFFAALPDGQPLRRGGLSWAEDVVFDDIYEAACACIVELNKVPAKPLPGLLAVDREQE